MKRARIFLSLGILTGCAGLIGVPDLTFDEQAEQGSPDGSTSVDGSRTIDGSTPIDGSAPACDESKLQTDPKHCGRCGHDCLGGACNAGKCESVVVKGGLENPVDLVADATSVYVTTRANGTVLRIAKADGKTDVLASGHKEARGVTLDGQNLFWSNFDYDGDGGDGYWGGVWGCALPACSDTRLVATGDHAAYVRYSEYATPKGHVYSALKANPSAPKEEYGSANMGSVGVAVDATMLYWTNQGTFDGNDVNQKDGEVLACPKAGCGGAAPIVLQQGLTSPGAITVTDDAVYFLTFGTKYGGADGELRRIAKP